MRRWLGLAVVAGVLLAVPPAVAAETAICYNSPPEWADWASELKAIQAKLGIAVPQDDENSGQSLSQLIAEKANPVADIYYGVSFGVHA